ncbi:MAG TPA: hypothetical protein VNS33_20740, partial [Bradyrhizobium sp.]|nr:hypothetical protein [Bradyrhizobium sp.]
KGPVAIMIATFETFVSCSAGMNVTIPNVERLATSQPLFPVSTSSRAPRGFENVARIIKR